MAQSQDKFTQRDTHSQTSSVFFHLYPIEGTPPSTALCSVWVSCMPLMKRNLWSGSLIDQYRGSIWRQKKLRPHRFLRDQVQHRLVVGKLDLAPRDLLFRILLLLQIENVLIEVELQRLVGIIDAQLFETVLLKVLPTRKEGNKDFIVKPPFQNFHFTNSSPIFLKKTPKKWYT